VLLHSRKSALAAWLETAISNAGTAARARI
jgi:hypothetical protein